MNTLQRDREQECGNESLKKSVSLCACVLKNIFECMLTVALEIMNSSKAGHIEKQKQKKCVCTVWVTASRQAG